MEVLKSERVVGFEVSDSGSVVEAISEIEKQANDVLEDHDECRIEVMLAGQESLDYDFDRHPVGGESGDENETDVQ